MYYPQTGVGGRSSPELQPYLPEIKLFAWKSRRKETSRDNVRQITMDINGDYPFYASHSEKKLIICLSITFCQRDVIFSSDNCPIFMNSTL